MEAMGAGDHIQEEVLEEYTLRPLSEAEVGAIEEHLLICEDCRGRLSQIDEFIANLGEAVEEDPSLGNCPED